jgi:WD40 repeat protein
MIESRLRIRLCVSRENDDGSMRRMGAMAWIALLPLLAASACGSNSVAPETAAAAVTPSLISTVADILPSPTAGARLENTPPPTAEPTPFVFRQEILPVPELDHLDALVFSPDGSRLLAGGQAAGTVHGAILYWDVADILQTGASRRHALKVPSGGNQVTSLAFSNDGLLLASGSGSGDVFIWDVSSWLDETSPIRVLPVEDNGLNAAYQDRNFPQDSIVASSSREATLAAAYAPYTDTGGVVLWDLAGGEILKILPATNVTNLAFSPDGSLLAVGTSMGKVALWSPVSGRGVRDYKMEEKEGAGISGVAFSPDGLALAVMLINGKVYLLNTYRAEALWMFDCGIYSSGAVAFSPDGEHVTVGIEDNIFFIGADGRESGKYTSALKRIAYLAFSPDGTLAALGDIRGAVELRKADEFFPQ